jgi:hypothetical protein
MSVFTVGMSMPDSMIIGRHEHVDAAFGEVDHHLLHLVLGHLAVADGDLHLRHQVCELRRGVVDGLDAVVHVEHLPAAVHLAQNGVGDDFRIELHDVRVHRQPVRGRRLDDAHVARAGEREVQGARDGRGGERQHVHGARQLPDLLLLCHAETMLLVDHHQAEVGELHVLRQQPVGADDDVDVLLRHACHDLLLLLLRAEARQHLDLDREVGEPLAERVAVLLGEDRRGHEHRHLPAVLHRLERGADRDLGLAVAHVAADQAVHGRRRLHVDAHVLDRLELVGRLVVGERRLELLLPHGVGLERVARERAPRGVGLQQALRHVLDRALRAGLGLGPLGAPERVDRGPGAVARRVARDERELEHRHVEHVLARVRQLEAVGLLAREREPLHAAIDADAVVLVNDEVTGLERGQLGRGEAAGTFRPAPAAPVPGKDLVVGEQRDAGVLPGEAGGDEPDAERGAGVAQHLEQAVALALVVAEHGRGDVVRGQLGEVVLEPLHRALERLRRRAVHDHARGVARRLRPTWRSSP